MTCKDRGHFILHFLLRVAVCGLQNPEDSQFEPHGWQRHYTGWYMRSGISRVYQCTSHTFSVQKLNIYNIFYKSPFLVKSVSVAKNNKTNNLFFTSSKKSNMAIRLWIFKGNSIGKKLSYIRTLHCIECKTQSITSWQATDSTSSRGLVWARIVSQWCDFLVMWSPWHTKLLCILNSDSIVWQYVKVKNKHHPNSRFCFKILATDPFYLNHNLSFLVVFLF